jgi:hypothetical protein
VPHYHAHAQQLIDESSSSDIDSVDLKPEGRIGSFDAEMSVMIQQNRGATAAASQFESFLRCCSLENAKDGDPPKLVMETDELLAHTYAILLDGSETEEDEKECHEKSSSICTVLNTIAEVLHHPPRGLRDEMLGPKRWWTVLSGFIQPVVGKAKPHHEAVRGSKRDDDDASSTTSTSLLRTKSESFGSEALRHELDQATKSNGVSSNLALMSFLTDVIRYDFASCAEHERAIDNRNCDQLHSGASVVPLMVQSGGRQSGESADAALAFESHNRFAPLLQIGSGDDDEGAAFAETSKSVKYAIPSVAEKQPLDEKSDVNGSSFFAGRFSLSDKYNQHFLAALVWIMLVVLMQVGMNESTVPSSHSLIEKSVENESSMFSQSLLLPREPPVLAMMEGEEEAFKFVIAFEARNAKAVSKVLPSVCAYSESSNVNSLDIIGAFIF